MEQLREKAREFIKENKPKYLFNLIKKTTDDGWADLLAAFVESLHQEPSKEKSIYDLKLHEGLAIESGIYIMRVPSGWLYDCWDFEKDRYKKGTFVPFDNSFQI